MTVFLRKMDYQSIRFRDRVAPLAEARRTFIFISLMQTLTPIFILILDLPIFLITLLLWIEIFAEKESIVEVVFLDVRPTRLTSYGVEPPMHNR
jgi:hypothetical protein